MKAAEHAVEHIKEILTVDNDQTSHRYAWLRQSDRDHLQRCILILEHWKACMQQAEKGTK